MPVMTPDGGQVSVSKNTDSYLKAVESPKDITKDKGVVFLSKYHIPADQWATWAAAAGYPGARWDDPNAAAKVAKWAADTLYAEFKNWSMVAVAWMYGAGTARKFYDYYGGVPEGSIIEKVFGEDGKRFLDDTLNKMAKLVTTPEPGGTAGVFNPGPGGGGGGEVTLKMTEEPWPDQPEPQRRGANPAHTSLHNVLGAMADKVAGGKRLEVQDANVQAVPETTEVVMESDPISNVTPEDTKHLKEAGRG